MEERIERDGAAANVERRTLYQAIDSWEGEMTYRGITYKVEVDQEDSQTWGMEVLQERKGCLLLGRHGSIMRPLHYSVQPTLQAALDAAANYIHSLLDPDADLTPDE